MHERMPLLSDENESSTEQGPAVAAGAAKRPVSISTVEEKTCTREEYVSWYAKLKNGIYGMVMFPFEMYDFVMKLAFCFGTNYVIMLFLLYGLNQGLGQGKYACLLS